MTLRPMAILAVEHAVTTAECDTAHLGLYLSVTLQYSSTTLYQFCYQIQ